MADDEKRATVSVHSQINRPIMLHLHEVVADDGAGRAFLGRLRQTPGMMPDKIELRPGNNPGVDKEFFVKWLEQNPKFNLLPLISHEDEH